jgi:hypothetical protein
MIWIGKIRITPREVTMKYTPLSFEVNLRPEGGAFQLLGEL